MSLFLDLDLRSNNTRELTPTMLFLQWQNILLQANPSQMLPRSITFIPCVHGKTKKLWSIYKITNIHRLLLGISDILVTRHRYKTHKQHQKHIILHVRLLFEQSYIVKTNLRTHSWILNLNFPVAGLLGRHSDWMLKVPLWCHFVYFLNEWIMQ